MTEIGISPVREHPLVRQERKHRELMDKLDRLELMLRSMGMVIPAELWDKK
jgi:hypothetical protein